jgi:hypothetical protein
MPARRVVTFTKGAVIMASPFRARNLATHAIIACVARGRIVKDVNGYQES